MEINYALIGKRIRETRKQRGLSAEELAEIADLCLACIVRETESADVSSVDCELSLADCIVLVAFDHGDVLPFRP